MVDEKKSPAGESEKVDEKQSTSKVHERKRDDTERPFETMAFLYLEAMNEVMKSLGNWILDFRRLRSSGSATLEYLKRDRESDQRRLLFQRDLLRELSAEGIDPKLLDLMVSNWLDRELKTRFAVRFFVSTVSFTLLSYAVIILNSLYKWGISDIAITALIVETPIQFIGLLYIIARNLFPQSPALRLSSQGRPQASSHQPTESPTKRRQGRRPLAGIVDD
jgi:hypothetical protein